MSVIEQRPRSRYTRSARGGVPPIVVVLPDVPAVGALAGKPYVVRELLGDGDSNTKLAKSDLLSEFFGYLTWGLSLSPANESGYQMCPSSTAGCRAACLYHQGRAIMFKMVNVGRIARTIAFKEHFDWFETRLRFEIERCVRKTNEVGMKVALRLNVVSDVLWEKVTPWVFEDFPDIQLYEYSKHYKRMVAFCEGKLPPNLHLTFSRAETRESERQSLDILGRNGNVAVVFRGADFPPLWNGYPVTDGDLTDLRFLDPPGHVIALRAKGTSFRDESGFVVDTEKRRLHELPLVQPQKPRKRPWDVASPR